MHVLGGWGESSYQRSVAIVSVRKDSCRDLIDMRRGKVGCEVFEVER